MARHRITEAFIAARLTEQADRHRVFYDDHRDAPKGFGVRVTKGGAVSFVLNYYAQGAERRATLGGYGKAAGELSITAARKRAADMRSAVVAGKDPLAERQAMHAAKRAAKDDAARKQGFGLLALLSAYAEDLKTANKSSWRAVSTAIARHIEPRKKLAEMPADEVTVDDVMPVFHGLIKAGKVREAEKLRAYMRAAYTAARKARNDATMYAFTGFRIKINPLSDLDVTRPKEAALQASKAARERKWALSEAQLAAYWKRISGIDTPRGALLRFHLLTGGQRVEQLTRMETSDFDGDQKTVTLHDTKGRRRVAHEHVIPLLPDAVKALARMRGDKGPFLFTISEGKQGAGYHATWEAVREVAEAMVKAEEVDRLFTPGTIRKTVETRLAAKGIPDEVLARLLSHGLGGVQARNYNAHHYDEEKRGALRKLRALCELKGKPGNVTPIRREAI